MLNSATTSPVRRRSLGSRIVRRPLLALAAGAAAGAALFPAQALAGTAVETYSQPGETAFVVPAGINQIHIDAFGGPGGGTSVAGGPGAEVQGDLNVSPGDTLYLEVGVGGGAGGSAGSGVAGGDGGGASEVRVCSIHASACTIGGYGSASSVQTRLLVAAGGGGSSWVNQDQTGIDLYLPHITGASSAAGTGPARILVSYSDFTAPAVSVQSPASQEQVGARPTFFGTAGGGRGDQPSVTVSIYQGQSATGSSAQTFTAPVDPAGHYLAQASPLASGTYTATIAQRDDAGNTGTASVTFSVDAAPPTLTITQPSTGSASANRSPTFAGTGGTKPKDNPRVGISLYSGTGTGGTPVASFSTLVSGGQWTAGSPGPLADGVYTVLALQSDDGGTDATSVATFVVDTTKPTTSVSAPAEGGVYPVGDHIAASYACTDGGSGIASCAGSVPSGASLDTSAVGPHTFTVVATDRAGNAITSTVHYTIVSSPQPPSSRPGMPAHGRSAPTLRTSSRLRVVASHLRALPHGCSQHPRSGHLRASGCIEAVVVSGLIDPRAADQKLTLTWEDGRGHVAHGTVLVRRGGHWSTTLRLPAGARAGSVIVAYAGNRALLPSSVRRTVTPAH
jgi:hypothetical protein